MGKLSAFLYVGLLICITAAQSTRQEPLKTFVASKLRKAPLKLPFSSSQNSDNLSIEDLTFNYINVAGINGTRLAELAKKFINRLEEYELELFGLNDVDESSIEFGFVEKFTKLAGRIKNFTSKLAATRMSTMILAGMVNNFTNKSLKALSDDDDSTELAKESDLELFGLKNIVEDNNIINKQSDIELFIKRELPMGRASHNKSHGTRSQSTVDTKEKGKTQKWHELFLAKKPKVKDDNTPVGCIARKIMKHVIGTTNF